MRIGPKPDKKRTSYKTWRLSKRELGSVIRNWDKVSWARKKPDKRKPVRGKYHPTAIGRKKPAAPVRTAVEAFGTCDRALYHGVGRDTPGAALLRKHCGDVVVHDPYHPDPEVTKAPRGSYDEVVSVYTLNVVGRNEGKKILRDIHRSLKADGHATIAVRQDIC